MINMLEAYKKVMSFGEKKQDIQEAASTKRAKWVPESIQDEDASDFMGAAAQAHKSGQDTFSFGGKKFKVTIGKDVAKDIHTAMQEDTKLEEAFINGREYASHGLMHPNHAKEEIHKVVKGAPHHIDFYAHGTGDKISGRVVKNDGKEVHIQADKNDGGKLHKFKVQAELPKQQSEQVEVQEQNDDEHYARQSKRMQDAINMHLRKGKSYKDAVTAARVHVKEDFVEAVKDILSEEEIASVLAKLEEAAAKQEMGDNLSAGELDFIDKHELEVVENPAKDKQPDGSKGKAAEPKTTPVDQKKVVDYPNKDKPEVAVKSKASQPNA
jgi:hypothetical protein